MLKTVAFNVAGSCRINGGVGSFAMGLNPQNEWQLPAPATDLQMNDEGFPDLIAMAFRETVREVSAVTLSRVPGRAAAGLLNERYDAKGYFLKAKTCDWGPMAGFVCAFPYFNKNGCRGASGNLKYIRDYLESYPKTSNATTNETSDPLAHVLVPLEISAQRKNSILEQINQSTYLSFCATENEGVVYVASNKDRSVLGEFIIRKKKLEDNKIQTYEILYGNILVDNGDGYRLLDSSAENSGFLRPLAPKSSPTKTAREVGALAQVWAGLESGHNADLSLQPKIASIQNALKTKSDRLWVVEGIRNRYPPYSGADDYRNAVTGDYDLFAVWPLLPTDKKENVLPATEQRDALLQDLVRITEQNFQAPHGGSLQYFVQVEQKQRTVFSRVQQNLLIEVVPNGGEISLAPNAEDPSIGNINDLVQTVAQSLNSKVSYLYAESRHTDPHIAYHSDEGGRPDIKEIEYPIAMFVPESVVRQARFPQNVPGAMAEGNQQYLIESDENFVEVLVILTQYAIVPIHIGWLAHLLRAACLPDPSTKLTKLRDGLLRLLFPAETETRTLRALEFLVDDNNLSGPALTLQRALLNFPVLNPTN